MHAIDKSESTLRTDVMRLAKGAGIAGVGEILFKIFTPVLAILTTRVLGADAFGSLTLVVTVVHIAMMSSLVGLDHGVLRFVAYYRSRNDLPRLKGIIILSLTTTLGISFLFSAVLFLFAPFIAVDIYHTPEMLAPLRLFVVFLPVVALGHIFGNCLQSLKLIKWQVIILKIIQPTAEIFFLVVFFWLGWRITGAIVAKIVAAVVALGMGSVIFFREASTLLKNTRPLMETRALLGFSVPLFLETMLMVTVGNVDLLMLGSLADSTTVGIFKVLIVVSNFITVPLMAFRPILAPMIADYDGQNNHSGLAGVFKLGARWTFLASFPVFLIILLFSGQMLSIFGPEFVIAPMSLCILCIGKLVDIAVGAVGIMLRMTGHSKTALFNSVFLVVFNILLDYLLIPRYGLNGAVIASASAVILVNAFRVAQVYYFMKFHPYSREFLKPLISGIVGFVVIGIVANIWPGSGLVEMILLAAIFCVIYVGTLVYQKLGDEDKMILQVLCSRFGFLRFCKRLEFLFR